MGGDFFGQEVMVFYCFEHGIPPCGRAYFLLYGQKKVAKEKATPGSVSGCAGFPALLETPGGCATRGCAPQTVLADCPRHFCVARHLPRGPVNHPGLRGCRQIFDFRPVWAVDRNRSFFRLPVEPRRLSGPLGGAEQRRVVGVSRLALFEPQASLASRPTTRVAQGTGAAGTDPGVAFSLATFFLPSKRKYARASSAEPQA